nr:hypothetical protein BaRGS_001635 [Batillaria attramentaria]
MIYQLEEVPESALGMTTDNSFQQTPREVGSAVEGAGGETRIVVSETYETDSDQTLWSPVSNDTSETGSPPMLAVFPPDAQSDFPPDDHDDELHLFDAYDDLENYGEGGDIDRIGSFSRTSEIPMTWKCLQTIQGVLSNVTRSVLIMRLAQPLLNEVTETVQTVLLGAVLVHPSQRNPYNAELPTPAIILTPHTTYDGLPHCYPDFDDDKRGRNYHQQLNVTGGKRQWRKLERIRVRSSPFRDWIQWMSTTGYGGKSASCAHRQASAGVSGMYMAPN